MNTSVDISGITVENTGAITLASTDTDATGTLATSQTFTNAGEILFDTDTGFGGMKFQLGVEGGGELINNGTISLVPARGGHITGHRVRD